jgi:hypothetical protein
MPYTGYTTAELELQVVLHEEGRVTQPARLLKALKAEIALRKSRRAA